MLDSQILFTCDCVLPTSSLKKKINFFLVDASLNCLKFVAIKNRHKLAKIEQKFAEVEINLPIVGRYILVELGTSANTDLQLDIDYPSNLLANRHIRMYQIGGKYVPEKFFGKK